MLLCSTSPACSSHGEENTSPSILSAFIAGRSGLWLESCRLALPSCEECWKRITNISNLSSCKQQEKRALRNATVLGQLTIVPATSGDPRQFTDSFGASGFAFVKEESKCGVWFPQQQQRYGLETSVPPQTYESEALRVESSNLGLNKPSRYF